MQALRRSEAPLSSEDISKIANISTKQVRRILYRLAERSEIYIVGTAKQFNRQDLKADLRMYSINPDTKPPEPPELPAPRPPRQRYKGEIVGPQHKPMNTPELRGYGDYLYSHSRLAMLAR